MSSLLITPNEQEMLNNIAASSLLLIPIETSASDQNQNDNQLQLTDCDVENLYFPESQLQKAPKIIDLKREFNSPRDYCNAYVCLNRICDAEFIEKHELADHYANYHHMKKDALNEMKAYLKCQKCFKKFDGFDQLMRHMCSVHLDRMKNNLCICTQSNCFLLFESEKELKKHKRAHRSGKRFSCELCSAIFNDPTSLKIHQKKHENPKAQCEFCSERFLKQSSLIKHISEKHKSAPKHYKCTHSNCEKSFRSEMNLKKHLQACVNKSLTYKCSQCDKEFPRKWYRNQHERIVHASEKKFDFICTFQDCEKSFPSKAKLLRHSKIHTEAKIYRCTVEHCVEVFHRKESLRTHEKVQHKKSQYVYKCDFPECNKICKNDKYLLLHRQKEHFNSDIQIQPQVSEDLNQCIVTAAVYPDASELPITSTQLPVVILPMNETIIVNNNSEATINLLKSISNDSFYSSDDSSNDSFYNENRVLDKYGLIDLSNKIDNNGNIYVTQALNSKPTKHKHVINMNSDDEEYAPTCVVVENLSGCARTDYKFNHTSIERNKWRKNKDGALMSIRSFNSFKTINEEFNMNADLDFFDIQDKPIELPTIDTVLDNNRPSTTKSNMINNFSSSFSTFNDAEAQLLQDVPAFILQ